MNSNLRFVFLHLAVPFVLCLVGTLALATPFLPTQAPHRAPRMAVRAPTREDRMPGSHIASSRLPSVVEQLDQIHDNYAQDVQDSELEHMMSAGVSDTPPVLPKPVVVEDAQHATNDADPWADRY